ncbi:cupin domain-containing protein [Catellatospora bangladeshensis]|uniref:Cupin n=1 Tax=Catellatospora bangladeshensis TaxID=310355 RepID=A0A8J3JRE0_9ACTN|nr:cupin domain-containing protein [Catellatospora bangladeshensis]GIF81834.1 cupin [Catellatospora bangladeshensis]
MTYTAEFGEVSGELHRSGEVEQAVMSSGSVGRFLAPGSATRGRFGLYEWRMPARAGGASAHFHRTFSESFYVVSGTVRLYDGARWIDGRPGDFLHVPEGGVHGFGNESDAEASMLILFAPGIPRETYFRELAEISATGRQLSEEEWTDLFARHDQYRA